MKIIKKIFVPILVCVFFIGGVATFKYLFSAATMNEAVNWHMDKIDATGGNVEMLFIGGSRIYRSFDPNVFEDELGLENVMNFGSPAQRPKTTYYLIKDVLERYEPKYIVLGATTNGLMFEQSPHDIFFVLDRLHFKNRVKCVIDTYGLNEGLLVLTGKSEFANNLRIKKIVKNVRTKKANNSGEADETLGKGYFGEIKYLKPGNVTYTELASYDDTTFSKEAYDYFDKTIQLCKKKNIKVFLVTGPCTLMNMYRVQHYQNAVDFYEAYAKDNGIKYFNMNFIRDREKLLPDEKFLDFLHVNRDGGQFISKVLANVLSGELNGEDSKEMFYEDFDELKETVHRIPGMKATVKSAGEKLRFDIESLHNDDIVPEYRILAKEKDGKYKVLSNWKTTDVITLNREKTVKYDSVRVEARTGMNYPDEIVAYKDLFIKKYK